MMPFHSKTPNGLFSDKYSLTQVFQKINKNKEKISQLFSLFFSKIDTSIAIFRGKGMERVY